MFIKINLLPDNLRVKKDRTVSFPPQQILSYMLIGVGILVAINIIIFAITLMLKFNINTLDKKFARFKPDIQKMQELEKKLEQSQEKARLMQDLVFDRFLWAQKLQIIADTLPQGVWLVSMSIKSDNLSIDGTCVSLKGEEMNIIGGFINALKGNNNFFRDFDKLELRSVQRRLIGGIEVADFNLVGSIKTKNYGL